MQKLLASTALFCHLVFIGCSEAKRETGSNAGTETAASPDSEKSQAEGPLKITIELKDNNFQSKGLSRSVFTLTNTGSTALPATGWKIFFNGGSLQTVDKNIIQVNQFNGDLHYFRPGPGFKTIEPGKSATFEVQRRAFRNFTDFPGGFYLVLDQEPDKGMPVALDIKPGNHFEKSEALLAAKIYEQNAKIKPVPAEKLTKIFPTPASYQEKGEPFVLTANLSIAAPEIFTKEATMLAEALIDATGNKPAVGTVANGKAIIFQQNKALSPEGYELSINPERVTITANTPAGAFYGVQSLKTLLPPDVSGKNDPVTLPGLEVKDAPRFGYRGFMMDMARNFQPKSEVLKVLDVMALYKMNIFHLHFSEDEGWRLEIPSLPELTQVGAKRGHSADGKNNLPPSYSSGPDASNVVGSGFYTKDDFVEILKYARDRHIMVIPEIETPGHARAAIKAMDARYARLMEEGKKAEAEKYLLRDLQDKSVYRSVQGWDDNVMNVALPSTYAFLTTVVDDIRKMYQEAGAPLKTIHFGGDEVPAGVWEKSPAVQKVMRENAGVKTTDDLWYYYFGKVNQMLKTRNLYLSGWEEIGLKKVKLNGKVDWVPNERFANDNFHVNVWKNSPGSGAEDLAYRMANAGYKVILTGVTHLYLDLAATTSYNESGQYWGGYVDIDKPFYFIPFDYLRNLKEDDNGNPINRSIIKSKQPITAKGKANIVGIEAPLWSENNRTPEQFEYKMLPKLLGVAERAWAKDPAWAKEINPVKSEPLYNQAWSEFVTVVGSRELPRLATYAGGYQYRIPTPGARIRNGKLEANVQFPGFIIRYTTDGSEPTTSSPEYKGPVSVTGTIKLKVFNQAGRAGNTLTLKT